MLFVGYFSLAGAVSLTKLGVGVGTVLLCATWCRGWARFNNAEYYLFISVLTKAQESWNQENKVDEKKEHTFLKYSESSERVLVWAI